MEAFLLDYQARGKRPAKHYLNIFMAECAGSFGSWIMWRKPVLEVKKKPIYRRWWFWVIAVIVVAGIVGAEEAGEAIASSDMPKGQASLVAIVAAAQGFRENRQRHAARRYQGQAGSGLVPVRRVDGSDRLDWAGQGDRRQ